MPHYFWWGTAIALALALLYRWWADRARRSGVAEAATDLGFRDAPEFQGLELQRLPLFQLSDGGSILTAIEGELEQLRTVVFDYRYRIGNLLTAMTSDSLVADVAIGVRKNREPSYYNVTCVALALPGNAVPAFELREENFLDRASGQDIDFPEDAEFSRRFFLAGRDEVRVRQVFSQRLRAYLARQPAHLCLESDGNWLLLYSWAKTVPHERLKELCGRATWIGRVLLDSQPGQHRLSSRSSDPIE